ncbi:MAG: glycosyltransferase family 1 protein [Clostridiales bacterium]|nr:glycosyltransferase family 1 protein [Clostridiales bacterium]
MIRILQCVNNMHRAGLETILMNYYRNIDRTKIQFDFLTHRPERADYDDEIEALGGRVFHAPRLYPQNYAAYFSFMKAFFKEHPEYQIMHSHIDAMSYLPLLAGKRAGVPIRIAHSHNTSIDKDYKYLLKQLFRKLLPGTATHLLSCGEEAGRFLFGNRPFSLIHNAIEPDRFYYNEAVRDEVRTELGLEGRYVIGHVGRFSYAKNHQFLLEIFAEVLRRDENAVLLLVGTGEKEQEIREGVRRLRIQEQVRFLGTRSDMDRLYQGMDVLVMPSLFEGVPVVGIEAQFAQLPCLFSDRVPTEVGFTELSAFLPLEQSAVYWAEEILKRKQILRGATQVAGSRYDVTTAQKTLTDYYVQLLAQLDCAHMESEA